MRKCQHALCNGGAVGCEGLGRLGSTELTIMRTDGGLA
jgi:hypothetical protein